ncbi:MAG: hypothetical protein ACTHK4_03465, partial [Mycobacteriales bacterium]
GTSSTPSSSPPGQHPSPANQPTTTGGGGPTSTPGGSGSHPAGVQTGPTKHSAPTGGTGSPPPSGTPAGTSARGDDSPGDSDSGMKTIIIVAGVAAAAVLVFAGWRGVRRA